MQEQNEENHDAYYMQKTTKVSKALGSKGAISNTNSRDFIQLSAAVIRFSISDQTLN
jgi:hypothetical protein